LDAANAAFREAIRSNPGYAAAHLNLGLCLREQGNYAESLAELRIIAALGSKQPGWRYSSAGLIRPAEQLAAIAGRLTAIFSGDAQLSDHSERLVVAQLAVDTKRCAAAARLSSQAFEFDPKLAGDLQANDRDLESDRPGATTARENPLNPCTPRPNGAVVHRQMGRAGTARPHVRPAANTERTSPVA
jgi:tetratricopeptide (TPR) repeat protein